MTMSRPSFLPPTCFVQCCGLCGSFPVALGVAKV